ncbi:MAG TPA: hypothetical protein VIG72_03510 [Pontibacter sp.]
MLDTGYKPAPAALAIVESYSAIVTAQDRTGRDLSLQNYHHEKSYATIDKQTIVTAATMRDDHSLWVERL